MFPDERLSPLLERPADEPQGWARFWQRFWQMRGREQRQTMLGVLRFYLRSFMFDSKEPIVIGPRVTIGKEGRGGRLVAGRGVRIAYNCVLVVGGQGLLSLGARTIVGPNTRIMAATQVCIGACCMISWNCSIFDSTGHRMWLEGQEEAEIEAPITIGDDVWLGPYSIIMKGVSIGEGSVIGAGSVVRREVPPHSLAYGNPARVVGKVDRWER